MLSFFINPIGLPEQARGRKIRGKPFHNTLPLSGAFTFLGRAGEPHCSDDDDDVLQFVVFTFSRFHV